MWLYYRESHIVAFTEPGQCVVFPKLIVPMETAQFMLLFLDCLLMYSSQLGFKEKSESCDICSKSHDASESADTKRTLNSTCTYGHRFVWLIDVCDLSFQRSTWTRPLFTSSLSSLALWRQRVVSSIFRWRVGGDLGREGKYYVISVGGEDEWPSIWSKEAKACTKPWK